MYNRQPILKFLFFADDVTITESSSSPMLVSRGGSKSATPSPVAHNPRRGTGSVSSQEWPSNEEDIDRLVAIHHNRSSLSSLGVSHLQHYLVYPRRFAVSC